MRASIQSHRDLLTWRKAMQLRSQVRAIVLRLPVPERFDVGRQATRAAHSIAAVIAEGHARPGRGDYKQYLSMAHGEAAELDTHLRAIGQDFPQLRDQVRTSLALLDEVSRMIMSTYKRLRAGGG